MYCLNKPLKFSFDPRCQLANGSANPAQLIEALNVWLDAHPQIKIEQAVSFGLEALCAAIKNSDHVIDLKNKTDLSMLLSLIDVKLAPDDSADGCALRDRMQSVALAINTSIELQKLAVFAKEPNRSALHAFFTLFEGRAGCH